MWSTSHPILPVSILLILGFISTVMTVHFRRSNPPFRRAVDEHEEYVESLRRYRDDKAHHPKVRSIVNWDRRWKDGIIHYEISPEFNDTMQYLIFGAMDEISNKTCITFRQRNQERDYVFFRMKFLDGCHTHAGRQGGKQILNLDSQRCLQHGKIAHELLHVLGFHHEHQRPDRDKYVVVDWDNIKPEDRIQMTKLDAPPIYLEAFPYDYGSILHYGPISFYLAIDREKPIIHSKRFAPNMGQRDALSPIDVEKVNILYDCLLPKSQSPASNEVRSR